MSDVEKMVVEFNVADKVVEVNAEAFEDRMNQFLGNFGPPDGAFLANVYSKDGIYIGSIADHRDYKRYYIPKKEAESDGNT